MAAASRRTKIYHSITEVISMIQGLSPIAPKTFPEAMKQPEQQQSETSGNSSNLQS